MFDINAARDSGYSDNEIADYLAQESGFNARAARDSGYSDAEIVEHLASAKRASGLGSYAKDAAIKLGQGAIDLGQQAVGLSNMLSVGQDAVMHGAFGFKSRKEVNANSPYQPEQAKAILGEGLSDEQKQQDANFANAHGLDKFGAAIDNPRAVTGAALESVPSMLAGMGLTNAVAANIFTKAAEAAGGIKTAEGIAAGKAAVEQAASKLIGVSAGAEGAMSAGGIAEEAQRNGKDLGEYAPQAVGAGLATGAIGYGSGKMFGDVATDLAAGTHTMRGGIAGKIAKGIATEGLAEEAPQSASETAFTNSIYGRPLSQGVADSAIEGGIVGGAMGGVMGSGSSVRSRPAPRGPLEKASQAAPEVNTPTIDDHIAAAAEAYGLPPDYLSAIAQVESGKKQFDANGKPTNPGTSSALGTMQIIHKWHPQYDKERLANDAEYNIHAGAEILRDLFDKTDPSLPAAERLRIAAKRYYGHPDDAKNEEYANKVDAAMGQPMLAASQQSGITQPGAWVDDQAPMPEQSPQFPANHDAQSELERQAIQKEGSAPSDPFDNSVPFEPMARDQIADEWEFADALNEPKPTEQRSDIDQEARKRLLFNRTEPSALSATDGGSLAERNDAAVVPDGSAASTNKPVEVNHETLSEQQPNALQPQSQQAPGSSHADVAQPVVTANELNTVDQAAHEAALSPTNDRPDPMQNQEVIQPGGGQENKVVKEPANDILSQTEMQYIKAQVKAEKLNPKSPGYMQRLKAIKAAYPDELDKALARSSFETYAAHPSNKGVPENLLRQGYEALQQEHGVAENGGVKFSKSPMKSVEANVKRGREAMNKALLDKTTAHRAMFRTGMGWVDFVWGDEGGKVTAKGRRPGAKGISHILEARQRKDGLSNQQVLKLLFDVVDTIAKGSEIALSETSGVRRATINDGKHEAILVKRPGSNSWMVTGYELHKPDDASAGGDALAPTRSESTPARNGVGAGEKNIAQSSKNTIAQNTDDAKPSKSRGTTGSTVEQVRSWLPPRVKPMLDSGKLEVVQSVDDLPKSLRALYHTAWHGSPHDHDKFDSSKIGTGEGAQAFGYGHYFTDEKGIAEYYRKSLAASSLLRSGQFNPDGTPNRAGQVAWELDVGLGEQDIKSALKDIEENWSDEQINNVFNEGKKLYEKANRKGALYEVELTPSQEEYLDWDKTLSDQSEFVKQSLGNIVDLLNEERGTAESKHPDLQFSGSGIYGWLSKATGSDKEASDYLRYIGIKGIRYKADSGKSSANNYVIFDDNDINITAKYSKRNGIEGLYDQDQDKIYLVADMLSRDNLPAVLAHELLHRGEAQDAKLKAAIDRFESDLDTRFRAAAKGYGSPIDKKAYARVISANTSEKNQATEFRAYMVSEYMRSPDSFTGRLKKIFSDFVASIRAFLVRKGLDFGFVKTLTPADLAALSKYGARIYQQGNTDNKILGQLASVFEWQGSAYDFQELELSGAFNDEFAKKKREFESIKQKLTENKKSDRETAGEKVSGVRFSISSPEDQQGNESSNEFLRKFLSEKAKDKLIYNLQDRYIDLKRQMQKVVNNGGNIDESEDAYLGEEVYHQRAAARIKSFMDDELAPVLRGLHRHKIDMDTFQKFLHARHAPSRNAVMAERNPNQSIIDANIESAQQALDALLADPSANKRDISAATRELEKWEKAQPFKGTEEERLSLSGMSNDEASRFINGLPRQERVIMTNLADKIDAINNKTLDLLVDYNMETPETIQALKDQWQHYVPLHRDEAHPEEGNFGHPIGRGFSVSGNGMKNATGSNAEVTNILAHIASAREQMIRRGEKNNVTVKLANLIHNHPDSDFAEISKIETHKVLDDGLVKTVHDPLFVQRGRDHVVMFRAKGKDFAIVFNERNPENVRLALSLKNMDGVTLDNVEAFFARGTRWLSSVNTQYNLVFGLINLLRDTQGMMLNLTSTPLAGKQKAIFAKMGRAIKIISAAERGWENVDPQLKAIYDQFNLSGGTTGYSQMFDGIKQRDDFLRNELDLLAASNARKAWKWFTKSLSDFNTVMENATRLAVFMQAKEQGLSDTKAASLSKNITVNFNRKGAYTTKVGAGYAFFNASMQGTARMYETLSGPKGRQIMLGGILLGAATALLGILGMGDDEWEKIPEFVRERSFISPVPEFIKKDRYVAFPMPLGFHIFPNIGRKIVEALIGSNRVSATQRFLQLAGSAVGAFNPFGGSDFITTITPTVGDPIVGLLRNKDWTGRQIYREDFSQLNPTPGFTRTKDTATGGSKLAAEAINKLMGGTDAKQGLWSPTPDQIDYVFGQIFGGTGRELMKAEQVIETLFSSEELPAHKIPLLGRLYGETTGGSVESQAYYENLLKMHEHKAEIEYLREHGRASEVTGYVANNPEARVLGATKRIEDQVDKMKKRRKQLKENGADKAKIRVIDSAITSKMKQLNDLVAAQ